MRNENKIREKLEELYALRNTDDYRYDYLYETAVEIRIEMLKWVLEEH